MWDVDDTNPAASLKIFAPNGDVREVVGWIGVRMEPSKAPELTCLYADQSTQVPLNPRVVVLNTTTGRVIYAPFGHGGLAAGGLLSQRDEAWLRKNPHWPKILELDEFMDNDVEEDDGDGIER